MSQAAYSSLKAAWHLDRVDDMRKRRPVVPVEVQLILSDFCNQSCSWCAYRAPDGLSSAGFGEDGNINPKRMIHTAKAEEIIRDCRFLGVKSIIFTGGGEPTVHPNHMELFEQALEAGIDCSLNTNGAILRRGWEEVLPRFKYIRFSVDAGTPEEYAATRQVPPTIYPKVLKNLAKLVDACNGCMVGTGYVVAPTSGKHLVEGVKRIRDTGASYVRLASMQSTKGMEPYKDTLSEVQAAIERSKELETDSFKVIDLFWQALGKVPDYQPCGFQHFVVYIGGNLKVYRCCYTAYTELGEVGDLTNRSFSDWIYDSERVQNRYDFDARQCETCPLDDKNRVINYVTEQEPLHVNFV